MAKLHLKKAPRKIKFPEIILAVLMLFGTISLGFSTGGFIINFKTVGFAVVSTLEKGIHTAFDGIGGFFKSLGELSQIRKENGVLKEQLKNYQFLQRNYTEIKKENDRFREQLGFALDYEYKNIPAEIISRDPNALYSGITLNKGLSNGIRKGMPVVAVQDGNVGVVGRVVTVGPWTCQVMPVYDIQCNISCRIQNTRDIGIVCGNGNESIPLSMKYVRKRSNLEFGYGDIVVTSGENANYMKDIPLGRITNINMLDYDSSLQIELTPILDFSRLENVMVIDITQENDKSKSGQEQKQ